MFFFHFSLYAAEHKRGPGSRQTSGIVGLGEGGGGEGGGGGGGAQSTGYY